MDQSEMRAHRVVAADAVSIAIACRRALMQGATRADGVLIGKRYETVGFSDADSETGFKLDVTTVADPNVFQARVR